MSTNQFVLNPDNGAWGIIQGGWESELFKELTSRSIPPKRYLGTHSILLNTTNRCNMSCIYCSAAGNRSEKKMGFNIAKRTLDECIKMECVPGIVFHGSEPLLNMPLIRKTVEYGEKIGRVKRKEISFYIQSNLVALTRERLRFIREHNIGVSTSIDGFAEHHNHTRPLREGRQSYQKIIDNIRDILEFQKGICVACVVTKYNVNELPEIASDLEEKGVTHIQFLPSVRCPDYLGEEFRPSNKELTKSYIKLFEQTFKRMKKGEQRAVIRNISQFISTLFLRTGTDSCRICSSTDYHPILAVDTNGDIYPCDYFFGNERYVTGNILKDSIDDVLNEQTNPRSKDIESTPCGKCDWRHICGGGCMADRIFSEDKPYYCETSQRIYEYFGRKIMELKDNGVLKRILEEI